MKATRFPWRPWACGWLTLLLCLPTWFNAAHGQGADQRLPVVTLRVTDAEASETGPDRGRFEVFRDGPTNEALLVGIEFGGSALNAVDYQPLPNFVTVPAGARSVPIVIEPLDDDLVEGVEEVVAELRYPPVLSPLPPNFVIGSPSNGVVRIRDNDEWPRTVVTIEAVDPEGSEIPVVPPGMGMPQRVDPLVFAVSRTGDTNIPLTVRYSVGGTALNGVDYARLSGELTIPAGALRASLEVVPLDDSLVEGTETVVVKLEPPVCIAIWPPPPECYLVGLPGEAAGRILDNDPQPNRPPTVTLTRPREGETFVMPAAVRIRADALDPDGYVPHIEFYAGEEKIGEQTRYSLLPPIPGQHHIFEMVWSNPPAGRHVLWARAVDNQGESGRSAPVTIWVVRPDEPPVDPLPVVSITAPDPVASEGTGHLRWVDWPDGPEPGSRTNTARFVVRRTGPTNTALTVSYAVGGTAINGVDYAELPGALTIPAGRRTAEIRIVPIDDSVPEKLETVVLRLQVPPVTTDARPPYLIGCPARAGAVIVDNDHPRPGPVLLSDRCFHLGLPAANGECYRIEGSPDLIHWTPLSTNVVVDGALHFVDPDADEAEQRFYRAVPEPLPAPEVE